MRLSGVVVRNENHGRFVPDVDPRARLRLTGTPMQSKEAHKGAQELNLYDLIDQRLSFECLGMEGNWVCGLQQGSVRAESPASANSAVDALGQRAKF
ncbi:MAG: hypothetical protein ACO1NO_11600 [Burkholderiaceae bacterium]